MSTNTADTGDDGAGADLPLAHLYVRYVEVTKGEETTATAAAAATVHPWRAAINAYLGRTYRPHTLLERARQLFDSAGSAPPLPPPGRRLALLATPPLLSELAATGLSAAQLFDADACALPASDVLPHLAAASITFDRLVMALRLTLADMLPPLDSPTRAAKTQPSPYHLARHFFDSNLGAFRTRMARAPFHWSSATYTSLVTHCSFDDLIVLGDVSVGALLDAPQGRDLLRPHLRTLLATAGPLKWVKYMQLRRGHLRTVPALAAPQMTLTPATVARAIGGRYWREEEVRKAFFATK